jgi:hypothetical protein
MTITELQGDWVLDQVDSIDGLMANYDKIKNCKLFAKFGKVCAYGVMYGLFEKMGIPVKSNLWDLSQHAKTQQTLFDAPDFAKAILDLVLFTVRQGRQSYIHGTVMSMFHTGETWEQWLDAATEVELMARHLSNPEALKKEYPDFTECAFTAKLKDLIAKGETMKAVTDGGDKRYVTRILAKLKEIDAMHMTKQSAQEMRQAPFGVFVYGFPGVGKTSVMDILTSYFSKLRGLPLEDKYIYTKNAAAKFYDGFASYMWCLVLDDVVCFRRAVVMGVDESVNEIIKVLNNVPYVPDQAALEDKGRTPMRAELVFATSNVSDMSLDHYFEKSGAAYRRFNFRVTPHVKPEYQTAAGALDSTKVPDTDGGYDDLWTFDVHLPYVTADMKGMYPEDTKLTFDGMKSFLAWFKTRVDEHFRSQDLMLSASKSNRDVEVCGVCKMPANWCECPAFELQNLCVKCTPLGATCANCQFCDCICKCEVMMRKRYNETRSRLAISRITKAQMDEAHRLEEEYIDGDKYFEDGNDVCDAYASVIDSQVTRQATFVDRCIARFAHFALYLVIEYEVFQSAGCWVYSFPMVRRFVHRRIAPKCVSLATQKRIMNFLGKFVDKRLGRTRLTDVIVSCLTSFLAIVAVGFVIKSVVGVFSKKTTYEQQHAEDFGGRAPSVAKEESQNVWYNDRYTLTSFDVAMTNHNLPTDGKQLAERFGNNIGRAKIMYEHKGEVRLVTNMVICLGGHLYVSNAHAFNAPPEVQQFALEMSFGPHSEGVSNVIRGVIGRSELTCVEGSDVISFEFLMSPPRKIISKFFASATFDGLFDGFLLLRGEDGQLEARRVSKIKSGYISQMAGVYDFDCHVFTYVPEKPTEKGDCGALLVAITGFGPQLLGYHFMLEKDKCIGFATHLPVELGDKLRSISRFPQFQPAAPSLSAPGIPVVVGELHSKSVVRYIKEGRANVFGTLKGINTRGTKSSVVRTPICNHLEHVRTVSIPRFLQREFAPSMHRWEPWRKAALDMMNPIVTMETPILKECAEAFLDDIVNGLTEEDWAGLHPYDIGTAVNGAPGVKYVDKMNRATSAGFPFNKSKKHFLHPSSDDRWADGVEVDEVILDRVRTCLEGYKNGVLYAPVFSGNLKDEPKSKKKVLSHSTRVFAGSPMEWSIVVRMKFLPLIRCAQKNRFLFEAAPGVNSHSLEWEEIREYLTEFGEDRMIAGDFVAFDKKMATNATMYAYWIMIEICKRSGNYSEEDIRIMWGIANDTCYPTINFNGDLIQFLCGNPSGQPLTVTLNGLVHSLYMRFVFRKLEYDVRRFKEFVRLATYGDDGAAGVSKEVPHFSHSSIQQILANVGIGYTMADKESASVPYISMNEVSFLKREWRYDEEVDAYLAPLEWGSINKMLTVHVRSKSVSVRAQIVQAMSTAVGEAFFHGREKFNELRTILIDTAERCDLNVYVEDDTFPTWEQLVTRFEVNSRNTNIKRVRRTLLQKPQSLVTAESERSESTHEVQSVEGLVIPHGRSPKSVFTDVQSWSTEKDLGASGWAYAGSEIRSFTKIQSPTTKHQVKERTGARQAVRSRDVYELQASVSTPTPMAIDDATAMTATEEIQNVAFANEGESDDLKFASVRDKTFTQDAQGTADLKDFLGRPVEIDTFTWTESSATLLQRSFTPWHLFFNDVRIRKKIDNFAYVKGNLHLKFTINASPFYYGALGAFYRPLSGYFDNLTSTATIPQIQIPISQRPHVWLNPQEVSTAEMTLPYFNFSNWLRLGTAQDFINFGTIDLWQFATLRSANGVAGTGVTITTYAWMEDVEICGPTVALSMQSRKSSARADEAWWKPNGQISDLASKVADVGGAMGKFGSLGQYAGSTVAGAANAVGSMAAMFGFTNTPIVNDVMPFKSLPFHSLASTEISEPTSRLTFDPKQSVDIDSSTTGLDGTDEMGISYLCQKESFLTGTLWTTTSAKDTLLFSSRVTPMLYNFRTVATSRQIYTVPMCMVGQLFQQWKGDVIYRFKFVRTKYHRGRVRITWDPIGNLTDTVSTTVAYTKIVDLETDDEFELRIPYMATDPFLRTWPKGADWNQVPYSNTTSYIGTDNLYANGTITVRVLNALTAPEVSSDIDILVFVRAADNLEFANPTQPPRMTPYVMQSKVETIGSPQSLSEVVRSTVGERIISLRQVLHRSSLAYTLVHPDLGLLAGFNNIYLSWYLPKMPLFVGFDLSGLHNADGIVVAGNKRYNFVPVHPLSYMAPAFVGRRGSVTWHHNVEDTNNVENALSRITVSRAPSSTGMTADQKLWWIQGNNSANIGSRIASNLLRERGGVVPALQGAEGISVTNQLTQAGMSTNIPHYSRKRFFVNNAPTWWADPVNEFDKYVLSYTLANATLTDYKNVTVSSYACAGPDFNFFFFLNTPDYWFVSNGLPNVGSADPPISAQI